MGLKEFIGNAIGIENEFDDEDAIEEEVVQASEKLKKEKASTFTTETVTIPSASKSPSDKRYSVVTSSLKLVLIEPKSFDECPKLVDSLKSKRPVIINLENIEAETARKIFDFLSGAVFALNGKIQKIANNIFIFLPENVSVSGGEKQGFTFLGEDGAGWNK